MTSVVSLKTRPKIINGESVAILKDYLAMAEAGEIVSVAIAAILSDGTASTQSSKTDQFAQTLGAIAILQHRMIAATHHSD